MVIMTFHSFDSLSIKTKEKKMLKILELCRNMKGTLVLYVSSLENQFVALRGIFHPAPPLPGSYNVTVNGKINNIQSTS